MGAHQKQVKLDSDVPQARTVTRSAVILNSDFVEIVRVVYVGKEMVKQQMGDVVGLVMAALHTRPNLVAWDRAAVDAALDYLEGTGQITLPLNAPASVS
jgi:hypothetical protein